MTFTVVTGRWVSLASTPFWAWTVKKNSTPMIRNGTSVYSSSSGRLYFVCRGWWSSDLRRYFTTTHPISPHTNTPITSEAIQEPTQR